jgi:hypothetical protein
MAILVQKSGSTSSLTAPVPSPIRSSDDVMITNAVIGSSFGINGTDYTKYLYGELSKIDRVNEPKLLDFALAPIDGSFVKPSRGSYVQVRSSLYGIWYTGFIVNDPQLEYAGTQNNVPVWIYHYEVTGDDYLLNLKNIGIVPPFTNTTQGAIVKYLIKQLTPAGWSFDVSGVQNGQTIARYVIDPNKKFSEIVKEFADAANYRFSVTNQVVTFVPQDAVAATIIVDGNSKHFTPSRLTVKPLNEPVINDVIVLGDIEPQNYINEWNIGDGTTAPWPLISSVFGVDRSVLLDDDFSTGTQGSSIDTSKWTVFDSIQNYLQVSNGFLNVVGGNNNNTYDVLLQSANLIPLEGSLRFTHGEFDFINTGVDQTQGVIAGLWTQTPSSAFTGCVFGIRVERTGGTQFLRPIVNGVVDFGSTARAIDNTQRYIIRTVMTTAKATRQVSSYSYVDSNGVVGSFGGGSDTDVVTLQTFITGIDPTTAAITTQLVWTNTTTLTALQSFAYYCPVVSNDLHCTVTGITVSTPMQVGLEIRKSGTSTFTKQIVGPNEIDSFDGLVPVATIVDANNGVTTKSSLLGSAQYNPGQAVLQFFKDSTKQITQVPQIGDLMHISYRRPGAAIARVQNTSSITTEAAAWGDDGLRSLTRRDLSPLPRTAAECELAAAALVNDAGYQHYEGTYVMPSGSWFSGEPVAGTILKFQNLPASFPSALKAEGISQVKTTFCHISGGDRFDHEITFGRVDTVRQALSQLKRTNDLFTPQDTAELPFYISAGSVGGTFAPDVVTPILDTVNHPSYGVDATNIYFDAGQNLPNVPNLLIRTEAFDNATWVKDGGSTVTANNVTDPLAASGGDTFTKGSGVFGNYADLSQSLTGNAAAQALTFSVWLKVAAGSLVNAQLRISDLTHLTQSTNVTVTTSWKRFSFTSTPGTFNNTGSIGVGINFPSGSAAGTTMQLWGAQLEVGSTATAYVANSASINTVGGFEVRYTDESWGADAGKNLVNRFSTRTFSVPRNQRGKVCFIKQYDQRNKLLWAEDITNAAWTKGSGVTVANLTASNPDGDVSQISTVTWGNTANDYVYQDSLVPIASAQATFSVSVNGPAGKQIRVTFEDTGTSTVVVDFTITLTGKWQRVSIPGTFALTLTGTIRPVIFRVTSGTWSLSVTRASLEVNTLTETVYCKTNSTIYGAMSRFAAGLKVSFPLVPPAITGAVSDNSIVPYKLVVTPTLPTTLQDVWGVEVRAADNTTVLYKKDLSDSGYVPQLTLSFTTRTPNYKLYTYNLLGEYSSVFSFNPGIDSPKPVLGQGNGRNLVKNSAFINNVSGYPLAVFHPTLGDYISDDWFINQQVGNAYSAYVEVPGFGFNGKTDLVIRLQAGASIPNTAEYYMGVWGNPVPVKGNTPYFLGALVRSDANLAAPAGITLTTRLDIIWTDENFSGIGGAALDSTGLFGLKAVNGVYTSPNGAAFAYVLCQAIIDNASGSTFNTGGTLYHDARFTNLLFCEATDGSVGQILAKGSVPPNLSGSMSYSATDTSITWSWSGLQLWRADGVITSIPDDSVAVTGLTASTTYFFYPYLDEVLGTVQFVAGGSGSPAIAQTARSNALAQTQNLFAHVPLSNGGMTAGTAASGGSGGGGGGGNGNCLRHTMLVRHRERGVVPIGTCQVGDWLQSEDGTWTQIVFFQRRQVDCFLRFELSHGDAIECTPTHTFTLADRSDRAAQDLRPSDFMLVGDGLATIRRFEVLNEKDDKVWVTCEPSPLFYAGERAPSILTHNLIDPC